MNYLLTEPCDECPFLKGSGFTWERLTEFASGEFGCHKTCRHDEESSTYVPHDKSLHCAGALILREKLDAPHQMMRICERLGLYDRTKLNMAAPVVESPADCPRGR